MTTGRRDRFSGKICRVPEQKGVQKSAKSLNPLPDLQMGGLTLTE
jgi:hypothetical protein